MLLKVLTLMTSQQGRRAKFEVRSSDNEGWGRTIHKSGDQKSGVGRSKRSAPMNSPVQVDILGHQTQKKIQNQGTLKYVPCWFKRSAHCQLLTHLCRPVRSTFAVRETASLGIMGAPRVPPSESIVI